MSGEGDWEKVKTEQVKRAGSVLAGRKARLEEPTWCDVVQAGRWLGVVVCGIAVDGLSARGAAQAAGGRLARGSVDSGHQHGQDEEQRAAGEAKGCGHRHTRGSVGAADKGREARGREGGLRTGQDGTGLDGIASWWSGRLTGAKSSRRSVLATRALSRN